MITDVAGRVRNIQVPASKPLLPLFETINNAIEAIADADESPGRIEVEVIRDENILIDRQLADISSLRRMGTWVQRETKLDMR